MKSSMPSDQHEPSEGSSLRIPGGLPKTSGFLRHTASGDLIIEFYDFSDTAESWFGNDVATLYTVPASQLDALKCALAGVLGDSTLSQDFAASLAATFPSVLALIEWLKASGVPYSKSFDSQA